MKRVEFDKIAEESAEELIKDIYRTCDWALDGYKVNDFNEMHSALMQVVVQKIVSKLKI
jgi:hypothetical protein